MQTNVQKNICYSDSNIKSVREKSREELFKDKRDGNRKNTTEFKMKYKYVIEHINSLNCQLIMSEKMMNACTYTQD